MLDGSCLRDAFKNAGIILNESECPDWISPEKAQSLCDDIGLTAHICKSKTVSVSDSEPLIIIHTTTPEKAHAVYVPEIKQASHIDASIVGIILLNKKDSAQ